MKNCALFLLAVFGLCLTAVAAVPPLDTDRDRVLATFAENIYGQRPDLTAFKKDCAVRDIGFDERVGGYRRDLLLNVMTPLGETNFVARMVLPKVSDAKRVPCFVYISFQDPLAMMSPGASDDLKPWRWPVKEIAKRGYATVSFDYQEVMLDQPKEIIDWGRSKERPADQWGAISCWALAASRVMDYLETAPGIDAKKVAVIGHSRLGKTALWAGATDTRFALTCINDSGCLGARPSSCNLRETPGETIKQIVSRFPHWFAPNAARFKDRDWEMPFDQHSLIAAIAPRLVAVGSGKEDSWACPAGEQRGVELARPAWKDPACCDYHVRPGGHDLNAVDWNHYLDFAAKHGW